MNHRQSIVIRVAVMTCAVVLAAVSPAIAQLDTIPYDSGVEAPSPLVPFSTISQPQEYSPVADRPLWQLQSSSITTGVVWGMGHGELEDRLKAGWTLQATVRNYLSTTDTTASFVELGGGYTQNAGNLSTLTTAAIFTSGEQANQQSQYVPDAYETRLQNLKRGHAQLGIGGLFQPEFLNGPDYSVQLGFRAGFRVGHVSASYQQDTTQTLDRLIARNMLKGYHINDLTKGTDGFWGIYGNFGGSVTYHDVFINDVEIGEVILGAELGMTHDWFSLGSFAQNDNGLATIGALFSLSILR